MWHVCVRVSIIYAFISIIEMLNEVCSVFSHFSDENCTCIDQTLNFPLDKVSIVDFVENSKKTNSILYLTNEYGKHVVLHSQ